MARKTHKQILLCFTGMPGSGKTTAAEIMKRRGFEVLEMRSAFFNLMKKEGIPTTSDNVRAFSTQIRKERGLDIGSKLMVMEVGKISRHAAIFGIRSTNEVNYFKKHVKGRHVYLIALILPQRLRFRRIKSAYRERTDETKTWREFLNRDRIETGWGLKDAIDNADFLVSNYGTKRELSESIAKIIRRINLRRKQDLKR